MIVAWLAASASAQDEAAACRVPLGDGDVRALAKLSSQAIFDDDPVTHKRVWSEFVRLASCLDHPISREVWATLLLDEAIVRYVAKDPWVGVFATAVGLNPDIERVPQSLVDQFVRPPPMAWSDAPLPEDLALFVDGVLVTRAPVIPPDPAEVHLVQVWRSGKLQTRLVSGDQGFPDGWLAPTPIQVIEVERADDGGWDPAGRGAAGLGFGVTFASQLVEDPGTWLADATSTGGTTALTTNGWQPVAGPGGAFWDGKLRVVAPSIRQIAGAPEFQGRPVPLGTAWIGPAVVLEEVSFGVGGGVSQLQQVEGGEATTLTLPQAHLAIEGRQGRGSFAVSGGASPSAAHAGMGGGWVLTELAPLSWRFGFDAAFDTAWLEELPPGSRRATVVQLSVVARVEAVWGADR